MKSFSHLWQYLTDFFVEWEVFQINGVEKMKTHILYSATFFQKSYHLWDNIGKCGGSREATDNMSPVRGKIDK
jgi:hypothetical protein